MTADPKAEKPARPQDPEMRVVARMLHALSALPTITARRRVLFYVVARLSEESEDENGPKPPSNVDRFVAALEKMAQAEHKKRMASVQELPFNFDGGSATADGAPGRETVRDEA